MMKIDSRHLLIDLIVISSIIPNLGIKFTTFGFTWTFYRTVVLVCIFIYFQMRNKKDALIRRASYRQWKFFMSGWILYGSILMLLSPYRDFHNGFIELLSLFNGAACMFLLLSSIHNEDDIEHLMNLIYWIYILMIIVGITEILTGFHLSMSYFNDQTVMHIGDRAAATGFFYSENDFSACITAFVPIMFLSRRNNHIAGITGIIGIIGAFCINIVNDANICVIAMVAGVLFYFVLVKKYGRCRQAISRTILFLTVLVAGVYIWINIDDFADAVRLLYVIRAQRINAGMSQGSLYARLTMYADSMKAAIRTWGIGIGPAAFTNYFIANPSASGLVNPHNLYLEILVEYGVIIAVMFVYRIFGIIVKTRRKVQYCKDKKIRNKYLIVCEMILLYCICCIASSSFMGYAWQWIIITLGVAMAVLEEKDIKGAFATT